MKPFTAQEVSDGVLAVSDSTSTKVTTGLSRHAADITRAIAAHLKAGLFEEAKAEARDLNFTDALEAQTKNIKAFTQSAALVGAGAVDRPQTSVMAQAGFPFEIDVSAVEQIKRSIAYQLTSRTRKRLLDQIGRAERFQKASDPIDPDKLANDINRFLRGEIRRVVDVSANITGTRVASHGMLYEATARGVTRYRIDATIDDRTTDICQNMHGREFSVEEALNRTTVALSILDPIEAKAFTPFPKLDEVRGQTNAQLQAAGFDVPPFHFLCRTVVTLLGTDTVYEQVPISKFPDDPGPSTAEAIEAIFDDLVSLTMAAAKVKSKQALSDAKDRAFTLAQHPGGDDTLARAYSVEAYTGNAFHGINRTLREKSRWESPDHTEISRTLDRAIADTPALDKDLIVYRGVSGRVLDQLDGLGKTLQDDGFVSTASVIGTAAQFGSKDAVLQILVPAGTKALPVGDLSLTKFEAEILLPRSTQFRVVGFDEIDLPDNGGKRRIIKMIVVGQSTKPDLDNLPSFDEWIEAQERLVKTDAAEQRARDKFFYTDQRDFFPVAAS